MTRNSLPSRDELLAFIRERSGNVGTREIARAFGAKNADRAELKRMLRDLTEGGHIERRRKRLHRAGTLPPVVLADVTGRDSDGELLARPTEWDEEIHGAPPLVDDPLWTTQLAAWSAALPRPVTPSIVTSVLVKCPEPVGSTWTIVLPPLVEVCTKLARASATGS